MSDKKREKYARVTEVLGAFSDIDSTNPYVVAGSARGTRVHDAITGILRGVGDWSDEQDVLYMQSFKAWLPDRLRPVLIEERLFNDDYEITGKVDLIAQLDGATCLFDWKTSVKENCTWPLQLSAYESLLCKEYSIDKVCVVHLSRDGVPAALIEYKPEDYLAQFLHCLSVYRYFRKDKKRKQVEDNE